MKLVKHVTTASRARDKQRRFRFFLPRTWRGTSRHQVSVTREIPLRAFSHLSVSSNPPNIYIYTRTQTHTQTHLISHLIPKLAIPNLDVGESKKEWKEKIRDFSVSIYANAHRLTDRSPPPKKRDDPTKKL